MQSQERELISGLFERMRQFEAQPRDAEAERLIADCVARQPAAPYLLTQTVLVQEQALQAAHARIAELESKTSNSGFLASAPNLNPWGAKPSSVPVTAGAQALTPPPANAQNRGGGGFMRSALATAAGVAGGALLFEGIRNLMGANQAQAAPLPPAEPLSSTNLAEDARSADDYDASDDSSGFDGGGSEEY